MKLSRYFLVFGAVILIGLGMTGGGIFLLVQRETGTRVQATVTSCTPFDRYGGGSCTGTWVVGGSLADGGHVVTGSIDGASRDDVGKELTVTVSGDHAYTRSLTTPIVLLVLGLGIVVVLGVLAPISIRRSARAPAGDATPAPTRPVEEVAEQVRSLRRAGRLDDAVALVGGLGPYGVADDDFTTSLGAAIFDARGDRLASADPEGARAAYRQAAELQRAFAAASTAGGEGLARMSVAEEFEAKARAIPEAPG